MNILNRYTLEILRKNKTRTLVTIIGIVISVSMITAVTALVASMQDYLLRVEIEESGNWYGAAYSINFKEKNKLNNSDEVKKYAYLQEYGYAYLEGSQNEDKPYLYIAGISDEFNQMMPVAITSGRMPKNQSEIIIPKHVKSNGGVKYSLGQEIVLQVGERNSQGFALGQRNPYITTEDGGEALSNTINHSYTVVGFYERPSFEPRTAPGYTALTTADNKEEDTYSCYIQTKDPKKIYSFMKSNFKSEAVDYNTGLLRYLFVSNQSLFNKILNGLAAILILIIMFASIMLIYNAFSISINERTKQFGLLSSIGASKRQLTRSVLFEAGVLSMLGIPVGVLFGNLGIFITLKLTSGLLIQSLSSNTNQVLKLKVSVPALLIAAAIGYITVLVSAYLPARRATHLSAIEAIRQNQDIRIKPGKLKTRKITYRLFGFEGMFASKNFKRNKRKYRTTVISLFVSVVLFITAGSFCSYLNQSMNLVIDEHDYDITYTYSESKNKELTWEQKKEDMERVYSILKQTTGVDKSSYIINDYYNMRLQKADMNPQFLEYLYQQFPDENWLKKEDKILINNAQLVTAFVEDKVYIEYLRGKGYDPAQFMNTNVPSGIAMDSLKFYQSADGYLTYRLLNKQHVKVELLDQQPLQGYETGGVHIGKNGELISNYFKKSSGNIITKPSEESVISRILTIDRVVGKGHGVSGLSDLQGTSLIVMYPASMIRTVMGDDYTKLSARFYFKTDNHKKVYDNMINSLEESWGDATGLHDVAAGLESDRALYMMIRVFSYGFIVLISLIAAANVFNTISTNIHLRSMEFAMLKSIGMDNKGFYKMMNYECLLYGFKGILYGLPVSVLMTYFIYRVILNGVNIKFYIPAHIVIIAVSSVFAVVFATMIYSMNKIKKNNVIDSLKSENL